MIQFDNIRGNHQIQAYKEIDNLKNSKNVNEEVNAVLWLDGTLLFLILWGVKTSLDKHK